MTGPRLELSNTMVLKFCGLMSCMYCGVLMRDEARKRWMVWGDSLCRYSYVMKDTPRSAVMMRMAVPGVTIKRCVWPPRIVPRIVEWAPKIGRVQIGVKLWKRLP